MLAVDCLAGVGVAGHGTCKLVDQWSSKDAIIISMMILDELVGPAIEQRRILYTIL